MKRRQLASKANPRLKAARRLIERKHREREGMFLIEGPHLLAAALERGARVREVFCTEEFLGRHPGLATRLEEGEWAVWVVPDALLRRVAATESPQGVVAVVEKPAPSPLPRVEEGLLVLALDAVADPGNLGTCVRSADGFGATAVVLGSGCCDPFNAKAVRASAGSLFPVPVVEVEDLAGAVRALREGGARAVATDPRAGRAVWEVDLRGPTVVVVGGEARGVSRAVRAECEVEAAVPLRSGVESLNAAVAAAVALFEARRQRAAGFRSRGSVR